MQTEELFRFSLKPIVTIIVCTLNREEVLCDTLRRVVTLIEHRNDAELIVVDQTRKHQDATEQCLTELAGGLQLYRVEFACLTRARNHGIRQATGEIILFLDDDVEPSPDLIDEHLACYADPAVWGVAGCTLLPGARKLSRSELSPRELADLEAGRTNRFDLDWPRRTTWAPGCNMSFRRDQLFQVGGFDEAFYGMAIGEEAELCHRLRLAGGHIQYSPNAKLIHLVSPSGGCRDAKKESERITQLLDNAWYFHTRINTPVHRKLLVILKQCFTIVACRQSIREWTWPIKAQACRRGVSTAFHHRRRTPILGLFGMVDS
jgi:GT2 family glycosyltransferase